MVKRFDKKLWKLHFNVSHIFNAITIRITKANEKLNITEEQEETETEEIGETEKTNE